MRWRRSQPPKPGPANLMVGDHSPSWSTNVRVIAGVVAPGDFDLSHRRELSPGRHAPLGEYALDQIAANNTRFDLSDVRLLVAGSTFESCVFEQDRKPDRRAVPAGGDLGTTPSTYRGCVFRGVRFGISGGWRPGHARFESCKFDGCRFEEHLSDRASYVGCTFVGPMEMAVFSRQSLSALGSREADEPNVFEGNDLSQAVLVDVGFRGFSESQLDSNTWPTGGVPTPG